jgi:hexosaminidase
MREGLGLPVLDRALAPVTPASSTAPLGLVPTPQKLTTRAGHVVLPHRLHGSGPHEWLDVVERVAGPGSGLRISPVEAAPADDAPAGRGAVQAPSLSVARDESLPEGAYRLVADEAGVAIRAAGRAGLVNAVATLRQLLPPWACGLAPLPGQDLVVPFVEIEDAPRFSWRGMHLDVGRHFQPLASLFRLVDLLSLHKLNYLHLHLTEDQGWRFEVKKYPLLTELGAVRPHTRAPHWESDDGTPHGGFYTQDQLRSLVAYAAERGITVVPEVDVPGHVRALLHAYPEFGEDPDGAGFAVATTFGVFDEVLHLTDHTVAMVEDVFAELLDVFPSEFIHIGGDECPKVQWQRSEEAARLAQERGLDGVELLQRWLTSHLRDWLSARGRRLVGWDEIIEEAEMPGAVVMSWRGTEPGIKALAQGNEVVMAPGQTTYFDHYQSKQDEEPYAIGGHLPWETVLAYDPTAGVPQAHLPRLRGVQAQLWTEYMPDAEHVQYMAFPRTAALAEVAWNATPADADEFRQRLRTHLQRLDASGVNYRPVDGPHPWQAGGTGHRGRPEGHAQEE